MIKGPTTNDIQADRRCLIIVCSSEKEGRREGWSEERRKGNGSVGEKR